MTDSLVLASASPRRADILRQLGIPFEVRAVDVDERLGGGAVADDVRGLAERKAQACDVAGGFVLAADTVGVLDGRVLGKPTDAADASRMLRALSGRSHDVTTGVAIAVEGRVESVAVATRVTFAALADATIDAYVATGEPLGKAGAYAIQGAAAAFVTRIEGSFTNVVGLPAHETVTLLARTGFALPQHLRVHDSRATRA